MYRNLMCAAGCALLATFVATPAHAADTTITIIAYSPAIDEPPGGVGGANFKVSRQGNPSTVVRVHFETSDVDSPAGRQYEPTSGDLYLSEGQGARSISVPIYYSPATENSSFRVTLSDAQGATIAVDSATVTVLNRDPVGTFNCRAIVRQDPAGEHTTAGSDTGCPIAYVPRYDEHSVEEKNTNRRTSVTYASEYETAETSNAGIFSSKASLTKVRVEYANLTQTGDYMRLSIDRGSSQVRGECTWINGTRKLRLRGDSDLGTVSVQFGSAVPPVDPYPAPGGSGVTYGAPISIPVDEPRTLNLRGWTIDIGLQEQWHTDAGTALRQTALRVTAPKGQVHSYAIAKVGATDQACSG